MFFRKEYLVQVQTVDIVWQGWVWRVLGILIWRRRDNLAVYRHGAISWTGYPPEGIRCRLERL